MAESTFGKRISPELSGIFVQALTPVFSGQARPGSSMLNKVKCSVIITNEETSIFFKFLSPVRMTAQTIAYYSLKRIISRRYFADRHFARWNGEVINTGRIKIRLPASQSRSAKSLGTLGKNEKDRPSGGRTAEKDGPPIRAMYVARFLAEPLGTPAHETFRFRSIVFTAKFPNLCYSCNRNYVIQLYTAAQQIQIQKLVFGFPGLSNFCEIGSSTLQDTATGEISMASGRDLAKSIISAAAAAIPLTAHRNASKSFCQVIQACVSGSNKGEHYRKRGEQRNRTDVNVERMLKMFRQKGPSRIHGPMDTEWPLKMAVMR
ncbi:hypothetical protein WN51_01955 [Melipona quadrifasciata]|uniref:Uncharacterized protein n=1 Tax=Melipona quadrifasciata TaxID=166423 RepID=A0A0M9AAQ1_9HYME|nr:hypothetical protein WN51_01955 [Melipona quadrifasciata]